MLLEGTTLNYWQKAERVNVYNFDDIHQSLLFADCRLTYSILYLLQKEIKGLSKVEQVLLDTADSVMDTKRKIEFGVQQIIFKVRISYKFL